MTKTIEVTCDRCGYVNTFPATDLTGEVPLMAEDGSRIAPPPVEINENTFVKCERCDGPASCENATISD